MKKALFALAATAAIFAPMSSYASDGSVHFTGSLTATTCTVTNGGATALNVPLPTLATTAVNPTGGDTNFSLSISGCAVSTSTATAYFEAGSNINTASGRLVNSAVGGPGNVELQLLNAGGSVINLAGATGSQGVDAAALSSGSGTAKFIVRYYHTDASAIAAGNVTGDVTYSMVYF